MEFMLHLSLTVTYFTDLYVYIYIIAHKYRELYDATCYKRADDNLTVMKYTSCSCTIVVVM